MRWPTVLPSSARGLPIALLALLLPQPTAAQVAVVDPGQGFFTPTGSTGLELSGLTHVGGEQWLAISDDVGDAYELTVVLAPDGTITSAAIGSGVGLSGITDGEGIAVGPGELFVADESGSAIDRFDSADGTYLDSLAVPPVFSSARSNYGLESLSRSLLGTLWTGNEEALAGDGSLSGFLEGTTVRLQRFGSNRQANGQWAYRTDPLTGDVNNPLEGGPSGDRDGEVSGLVDLVALDDDRLLALERAGGGDPSNNGAPIARNRIYLIDLACATDTSGLVGLDGESYTVVGKTLLWERVFPVDLSNPPVNFEGIGLGPELADGSRSLLLISDDGSSSSLVTPLQALYPLKLAIDPDRVFSDDFERGCVGRWSSATP